MAIVSKLIAEPIIHPAATQSGIHLLLTGTSDTVGTTGAWHVLSNNINSVPRQARIEIDIRDIDQARRDKVVESVLSKVESVAKERGVTYKIEMINQDPPATAGKQVCTSELLHPAI